MNFILLTANLLAVSFGARINTVFVTETATATATATAMVGAPPAAAAAPAPQATGILDAVKNLVPPPNNSTSVPLTCKSKMDKAMEIGMTSWWHCDGPAISCLAQAMLDVQMNLGSANCTKSDCFPPNVPANIDVLRDLGKKYWPEEAKVAGATPENKTISFTPYMELLANILVQKSRFCRIDIDVMTHLTELVAASYPCVNCATNSTVTTNSTTSVSQQQIVVTSATTMFKTLVSQYTIAPK